MMRPGNKSCRTPPFSLSTLLVAFGAVGVSMGTVPIHGNPALLLTGVIVIMGAWFTLTLRDAASRVWWFMFSTAVALYVLLIDSNLEGYLGTLVHRLDRPVVWNDPASQWRKNAIECGTILYVSTSAFSIACTLAAIFTMAIHALCVRVQHPAESPKFIRPRFWGTMVVAACLSAAVPFMAASWLTLPIKFTPDRLELYGEWFISGLAVIVFCTGLVVTAVCLPYDHHQRHCGSCRLTVLAICCLIGLGASGIVLAIARCRDGLITPWLTVDTSINAPLLTSCPLVFLVTCYVAAAVGSGVVIAYFLSVVIWSLQPRQQT